MVNKQMRGISDGLLSVSSKHLTDTCGLMSSVCSFSFLTISIQALFTFPPAKQTNICNTRLTHTLIWFPVNAQLTLYVSTFEMNQFCPTPWEKQNLPPSDSLGSKKNSFSFSSFFLLDFSVRTLRAATENCLRQEGLYSGPSRPGGGG